MTEFLGDLYAAALVPLLVIHLAAAVGVGIVLRHELRTIGAWFTAPGSLAFVISLDTTARLLLLVDPSVGVQRPDNLWLAMVRTVALVLSSTMMWTRFTTEIRRQRRHSDPHRWKGTP